METLSLEDGTWTIRVPHHHGSVWTAWISRSSVSHPRFQRARFVLGDEQTILISAEQLRAALSAWLAEAGGRSVRPVKIDTDKSTLDGFSVEIEHVA